VTRKQVDTLRGAHVFAMNRTIDESKKALVNRLPNIYWGIGVHPGRKDALEGWNVAEFRSLLKTTFLVGEVGLTSNSNTHQLEILYEVLTHSTQHIVSVHSPTSGDRLVELIDATGHRGVILHWFRGGAASVAKAVELGCFFSVNAAMSDEQLLAVPTSRMLPETDYPSAKSKTRARVPGDTSALEARVSELFAVSPMRVRAAWYRNLGSLLRSSGAEPAAPARLLESVQLGTEVSGRFPSS
jgi:TatD DNase family protein